MVGVWMDGSVLTGEASQYAVWAIAIGRVGQAKRTLVGWNHRDGHGSARALRLPRLDGWMHPHRAELIAAIQGLYQVRLAGHRQIFMRTDAQTLVRALRADDVSALTPRQELDIPLWALYYGLKGGFEWVGVTWVPRYRLAPLHHLAYDHIRALKKSGQMTLVEH